jgi:hypothetical protein
MLGILPTTRTRAKSSMFCQQCQMRTPRDYGSGGDHARVTELVAFFEKHLSIPI